MIPGVTIPTTGKLAALFRVPIPYVLEWRINGTIVASISTPHTPQSVSIERAGAVDLQFTLGEDPIIESSENKSASIQLKGVSGQAPRAGYNRTGQVIFKDGPSILREFDRFLDYFQKTTKELEGVAPSELIFRAIGEDAHYKVVLGSFMWAREAARSRTMVDWSLVLRGYGRADSVKPLNILSPISDLFEAAAAKIDEANAYLAVASNATTNLRGDMEALRAPILAVQRSAQALGSIASAARSLTAFPRDLMADFANTAGILRDDWEEIRGAISLLDPTQGGALRAEWDRMTRSIGFAVENAARDAATSLGFSGGGGVDLEGATSRGGEVRPGLPLLPSVSVLTLRPGEDLRDVADRVLGDRDRWAEIATINGWTSPYRTGQGQIARAGLKVKVPAQTIPQVMTEQAEPLGRDLFLSAEGELDWTSGDLLSIRGAPNFEQALRNRVFTVLKEIPSFPRYGLPDFIGEPLSGSMRGLVASHISEQLQRDQRVLSLSRVEILDLGDRFAAEVDIIPSEGPPYTLALPL